MRPSPDRSRISSEAVARRATPKNGSGPCAPASDWLQLNRLRPMGVEAVRHVGVIGVKRYFDELLSTMGLLFIVVELALKQLLLFNRFFFLIFQNIQ